MSYANIVATLALVFAMSGGALAAKHYLINSTKQINPKVLKKLTGKKGATGATGKEGTPGKEGPQGKEGPGGKAAAPATTLWAGVGPEGALKKGSGVVSTKALAPPGVYEVVFNRKVTECVYEGTLGSALVSNTEFDGKGPGEILVEPRKENPEAIFVEISNSSGVLHENAFHLAVFC
jgi:hypothetical protein